MFSHLVVPTRDRPQLLRRCLESYRANLPGLSITVADESLDSRSRDVCGQLATVYVGSRERAAFLDRVSTASHVSRELLEWGTRGLGGTRNLLQLMMAGRVYASADDDTLATFYVHGDPGRVPVRRVIHDPTRIRFYKRLDTLPDAATVDPMPALGNLIRMGASVAQCGQLGDCGMAGPMGNGDRYERARRDRIVRRHVDAPTLTLGGHLMLHCAAFDGRKVLPPFYPTGRGEDAIFAACLGALGQWVGHAPIAATHLPGDSAQRGATPREARPSDDLLAWVGERDFDSLAAMGAAMRRAGFAFGELAARWDAVTEAACRVLTSAPLGA